MCNNLSYFYLLIGNLHWHSIVPKGCLPLKVLSFVINGMLVCMVCTLSTTTLGSCWFWNKKYHRVPLSPAWEDFKINFHFVHTLVVPPSVDPKVRPFINPIRVNRPRCPPRNLNIPARSVAVDVFSLRNCLQRMPQKSKLKHIATVKYRAARSWTCTVDHIWGATVSFRSYYFGVFSSLSLDNSTSLSYSGHWTTHFFGSSRKVKTTVDNFSCKWYFDICLLFDIRLTRIWLILTLWNSVSCHPCCSWLSLLTLSTYSLWLPVSIQV